MGHPALSAAPAQPAAPIGTATNTASNNLLKNTPVKGNVFSAEHHHTQKPPAKQPPAASCTRGHSLAWPIPTWALLRVSAVSGDETSTHGHTSGLPQNPQVSALLPILHHCLPLGCPAHGNHPSVLCAVHRSQQCQLHTPLWQHPQHQSCRQQLSTASPALRPREPCPHSPRAAASR